jgi:DNA-binding winged helix-turn-helix (wHTH) protein
VRFGGFVLDSEMRQLSASGAEVHLSPKAFDLLCALVGSRPNVISKGELFSQIWPDTFVVDANLNVLVGEIRRAIGDDARTPAFIKTAHGVGYSFCGTATDLDAPVTSSSGDVRWWLSWNHRTFRLSEGDNIIGRDPRCDVWLDHDGISRRHARIRIATPPQPVVVEDLQSTNGTFVGRDRVVAPRPLADKDVIKLGSVAVQFREWSETTQSTRRIRGRS